jgi:hypothetical protein
MVEEGREKCGVLLGRKKILTVLVEVCSGTVG